MVPQTTNWTRKNILVNASAPGWVRTDMAGSKATKSPDEGTKLYVYLRFCCMMLLCRMENCQMKVFNCGRLHTCTVHTVVLFRKQYAEFICLVEWMFFNLKFLYCGYLLYSYIEFRSLMLLVLFNFVYFTAKSFTDSYYPVNSIIQNYKYY